MMIHVASRSIQHKPNLFLALDAFGTLFTPKQSIAKQYSEVARQHGLSGFNEDDITQSFKAAFKAESKKNPNYGRATDMRARLWWENIIHGTFQPFLKAERQVPTELVKGLYDRFATREGYNLFPDVLPFFKLLRDAKIASNESESRNSSWPWHRTVVGIITNSDDRVAGILQSLGLSVSTGSMSAATPQDVDLIILSYDVGIEKPSRKIFDAAIAMLDQTPQGEGISDSFEKLYVGDDLEKDYFGAKGAGWQALRIDREHPEQSEYLISDNEIVSVPMPPHLTSRFKSTQPIDTICDLRAIMDWKPKPDE